MDAQYTQLWWQNVQPVFEQLGELAWPGETPPAMNMLEIGSFEGMSSRWLLENWLTHESSTITCIDTWMGGMEHQNEEYNFKEIEERFNHNLKPYARKVLKVKGTSVDGLSYLRANGKRFHAAYIDGGHTSKDVLLDLMLSHDLLLSGALVICDDYMWTSPDDNPLNTPKFGIDTFMHLYCKDIKPFSNMSNRVMCWIKA